MRDIALGFLVLCLLPAILGVCVTVSENLIHPTTEGYSEVEMNVSAYCPCEKCCGEWADGITASGKPAEGKLIAAPRKYAFGTVMEVPGYGRAVVEDRGGAIKGDKIDLLFPTHQDALNWGRQYVKVKVYR